MYRTEQSQMEQNSQTNLDNNDGPLTADDEDDMQYLQVGSLERARRRFCLERSQWVDECISLIKAETLEALPRMSQNLEKRVQQNVTALYNSEAAAAEYLMLHELEQMELILVGETRALEDVLRSYYMVMVKKLETRRGGTIEAIVLRRKLFAEGETNIMRRITKEEKGVQQRITRLRNEARARIKERGFRGATEAWLEDRWQKFENRVLRAWEELRTSVQYPSDDVSETSMQVAVADNTDVHRVEYNIHGKLSKYPSDVDEASQQASVADKSSMNYDDDYIIPLVCHWHASDEATEVAEGSVDDIYRSAAVPDFTRFTEHVRRHIEEITDPQAKTKLEGQFLEMVDRSRERQYMVQQRLRDERATMEGRLSRAKEDGYDGFLDECKSFKSSSFAARLALSKTSKFIYLPFDLIKENGIITIAKALERNTIVSCADCTKCSLDEVIKIISSLSRVKSVTIILPTTGTELLDSESELNIVLEPDIILEPKTRSESDAKLVKALRQHKNILSLIPRHGRISTTLESAILKNRMDASEYDSNDGPLKLTYYEYVEITDYYARGNAYLLFGQPGESRCTVLFSVPIADSEDRSGTEQLILRLVHCRTTSDGEVNINLNTVDIRWEEDECPRDNFGAQDIMVPGDALQTMGINEVNKLTITLRNDSWGVYWLRDVQLVWSKAGKRHVW